MKISNGTAAINRCLIVCDPAQPTRIHSWSTARLMRLMEMVSPPICLNVTYHKGQNVCYVVVSGIAAFLVQRAIAAVC